MEVTMLGTGSPVPMVDRAGTSLAVTAGNETALVDCGPNTVQRLLKSQIDPAAIEQLFFTHQHMDHNADFFQFVIGGWSRGRENLTLHGPPGTERLVESLEYIYDEDIAYRQNLGYPLDGIKDIECNEVRPGDSICLDTVDVSVCEVDHSIKTYAYRFDDVRTGESIVFTGDTDYLPSLDDFAAGADVLIHDCCMAPPKPEQTGGEFVWEEFTNPLTQEKRRRLSNFHADAEEAGTIAADADVDTLVLTHLLPYRDQDAIRESARTVFDGEIVVAEDNMTIRSSNATT